MATRQKMLAELEAFIDEQHASDPEEFKSSVKTLIGMRSDADVSVLYQLLLKKRFGDALCEVARRFILE